MRFGNFGECARIVFQLGWGDAALIKNQPGLVVDQHDSRVVCVKHLLVIAARVFLSSKPLFPPYFSNVQLLCRLLQDFTKPVVTSRRCVRDQSFRPAGAAASSRTRLRRWSEAA